VCRMLSYDRALLGFRYLSLEDVVVQCAREPHMMTQRAFKHYKCRHPQIERLPIFRLAVDSLRTMDSGIRS